MGKDAIVRNQTLFAGTENMSENDELEQPFDLPGDEAIEIFIWADPNNPGEAKWELFSGFQAQPTDITEDFPVDSADGITTPANFDQGDAFMLKWYPSALGRKVIKYDHSAGAGSKWATTFDETLEAPPLFEQGKLKITADSNAGTYNFKAFLRVKG